jgi:hypothetical protein
MYVKLKMWLRIQVERAFETIKKSVSKLRLRAVGLRWGTENWAPKPQAFKDVVELHEQGFAWRNLIKRFK